MTKRTDAPILPCPACGFIVLHEGYGSYEVCRVCGWDDDAVQLGNPCSGGGANQESLAEAQAVALRDTPVAISEKLGFVRSPDWRPLTSEEISKSRYVFADVPAGQHTQVAVTLGRDAEGHRREIAQGELALEAVADTAYFVRVEVPKKWPVDPPRIELVNNVEGTSAVTRCWLARR